jgi:hypothetical protein
MRNLWVTAFIFSLSLLAMGSTQTLGLRFQETLTGHTAAKEGSVPCSADLEMKLLDVDSWSADTNHAEVLKGFFTWAGNKVPVEGYFLLMKKADNGGGYHIVYSFHSLEGASLPLSFEGYKTIQNKKGNRNPTVATTLLKGTLTVGQDTYPLNLLFDLKNKTVVDSFVRSYTVFSVVDGVPQNTTVPLDAKLHVYRKFFGVFLGGFGREYLLLWKYLSQHPSYN